MADVQPQPTEAQRAALKELGVAEGQFAALLRGETVVYLLPTRAAPGVAILQLLMNRLRSGVVAINDPGGGVLALARFRECSEAVARSFDLAELELFGAAVSNSLLESMLVRQGFERQVVPCPEELGGGEMDILTRIFTVE